MPLPFFYLRLVPLHTERRKEERRRCECGTVLEEEDRKTVGKIYIIVCPQKDWSVFFDLNHIKKHVSTLSFRYLEVSPHRTHIHRATHKHNIYRRRSLFLVLVSFLIFFFVCCLLSLTSRVLPLTWSLFENGRVHHYLLLCVLLTADTSEAIKSWVRVGTKITP